MEAKLVTVMFPKNNDSNDDDNDKKERDNIKFIIDVLE
jgi:hypothetical protein